MWARILLGTVIVLSLCSNLYAGPASQNFTDLVQPDGSILSVRQQGDEFQHWTETKDGYTVLRNPATNYWEYAMRDGSGELKPSGYRVLQNRSAPTHIAPSLKPRRNSALEQHQQQTLKKVYQDRLKGQATSSSVLRQAAIGDWTPVPVAGEKKVLLVLINFADLTLVTTAATWGTAVFPLSEKSVAKYYADNSFTKLSVAPVTHTQEGNPTGVVTVTIAAAHPNGDDTLETETSILNLALEQTATFINFSAFDSDSSGTLESTELTLYFIYAGYEASGSVKTPRVWAHAWGGDGVSVGGLKVSNWDISGELNNFDRQEPMGLIAHELGHTFCGLLDLYDTSDTNAGMGIFSLMAAGSSGADIIEGISEDAGTTPTALDLWSREYLGWSTPAAPGATSTLTIPPALTNKDSGYKLMTAASSSEYFLLENRQPSGWDLGARNELGADWQGGLLLTHIDITAGTFGKNDINTYTINRGRQGVLPVQASTATCDMTQDKDCWGAATTLFYAGNNSSWTPLTAPDSNYYDGTSTGFSLTGISAPAEAMTAEWATTPVPPLPVVDDFESGDFSKLPWLTSGNADWTVIANGYNSIYAAEAPPSLSTSQNATLKTTVETGAGALSFRYAVNSEAGSQSLIFSIDDVEKGRWSGNVDWSRAVYPLTAGTHTLTWTYANFSSTSVVPNTAWIDDLSFPIPYQLSVMLTGNGDVTPNLGELTWTGSTGSATYNNGTTVTLTANPDRGYTFTGWGGACSGSEPCVVTMNASKEVSATFVINDTPTITAFTLPVSSSSLTVTISNLTAIDNVAVTGYCLAESNSNSDCSWTSIVPSSYTFKSTGEKTLYAFVSDSDGNISASVSASTTIVIYGDLNNDNETTSYDALLALQIAIEKQAYDLRADLAPLVDKTPAPDGKVTAADVWLILRRAVNLW